MKPQIITINSNLFQIENLLICLESSFYRYVPCSVGIFKLKKKDDIFNVVIYTTFSKSVSMLGVIKILENNGIYSKQISTNLIKISKESLFYLKLHS